MTSVPPHPSAASAARFCLALFGGSLVANLWFSSQGLTNTLLGAHEFRQAHTAVSVLWYLKDGVTANYTTPLLGPPWAIPYEFPLYQACTAWLVQAAGWSIESTGRVVSWLFFVSALPACYLLLERFRVPPRHRLVFLALLLTSPLYLFFSRAILIESSAFALCAWFLVGFDRFLTRPQPHWFALAAAGGILGGITKVTTLGVFLLAASGLLLAALRGRTTASARALWVRAAAAMALPFLATAGWTIHAAGIRHLNPEMVGVNDHLWSWVFGPFSLRCSPQFWLRNYQIWSGAVVSEAGVALVALYYCWLRGRYRWAVTGCLGVFLAGQLIFANLYWVHDHYFYENGVFLIAALGFFLAELLESHALSFRLRCTFVAVVVLLQLGAFARTYLPEQATVTAVPEEARLLQSISAPDDIIVVVGHDWNGSIPFYAERRALMILQGRENHLPALRRTIDRLDPSKVAAVLIQGPLWDQKDFVAQTMASLHLGPRPFLFRQGYALGLWVPESRQPALRDTFDANRFPAFDLAPDVASSSGPRMIYARQIQRRAEFAEFHPRPVRAVALAEFAATYVDSEKVLFSHAPSELVFHPAPGARRLTAQYGIDHGAYTGANRTDGVEFVISERTPDGVERELFRRFVEPLRTPADTGVQTLDLTLEKPVTGEIYFRTLIGPHHNGSFDWSFWGHVNIR